MHRDWAGFDFKVFQINKAMVQKLSGLSFTQNALLHDESYFADRPAAKLGQYANTLYSVVSIPTKIHLHNFIAWRMEV